MKRRIISILLSLIFCFSFFVGCSDKDDVVDENSRIVTKRNVDGTHVLTAPERSNEYFVKNGRTSYRIIAPETQSTYLNSAIEEFNFFFNEATGSKLSILTEIPSVEYKHSSEQRYISIGNTRLLQSTGLADDISYLGEAGVRIVTVDNNIYLFSTTDRGALYAVYDFMQIMFNYEIFSEDCFVIDKVSSVKMRNFDVTDIPDCSWSVGTWGPLNIINNPLTANRFRSIHNSEMGLLRAGDIEYPADEVLPVKAFHNTLRIISQKNPNVKKEWISTSADQLCYTARGDSESLDQMISHTAEILIKNIVASPTAYFESKGISVSAEDSNNVCSCSGCKTSKEKYGTDSAAVMIFCNRVMEEIEAWWETEEGKPYKRDDFYLVFFAYTGYSKCPATYNKETGKYEPNAPELQLKDNIAVWLTQTGMNPHFSIYDEVNDAARESWAAWQDISSAQYVWLWDNNFEHSASVFDTFSFFNNDGFQFLFSDNLLMMFKEAQSGVPQLTGFSNLKMYLQCKLSWDSNLDYNTLIDDWFNAMFGAASETMKTLFDDMRLFEHTVYDKMEAMETGEVILNIDNLDNWSAKALVDWVNMVFKAQQINLEQNANFPERYAITKKNIDYEFMYPAIMLLNYYTPEQAGSVYYDVAKYLQDNNEFFEEGASRKKGFWLGRGGVIESSVWNSISVDG